MTDQLFDITGQRVVITGGSGVLGSCMAEALGQRGARVAVCSRTQEKAERIVGEFSGVSDALPVAMDVTDRANVEKASGTILDAFGGVDVLVNCAGGNHPKATVTDELSIFDIPADALEELMKLNFVGSVIPTQVLGQKMASQKSGCIINISSMAAYRPMTKVVAYSASKAAIDNLTYWLAVHMATKYSPAIRVNAIAPGFFLTEQNRALLTDVKTGELTPRGKTIVEHTPMGRLGEPPELISTLIWLISPGARFVTGTIIPVDGGFSAFAGV